MKSAARNTTMTAASTKPRFGAGGVAAGASAGVLTSLITSLLHREQSGRADHHEEDNDPQDDDSGQCCARDQLFHVAFAASNDNASPHAAGQRTQTAEDHNHERLDDIILSHHVIDVVKVGEHAARDA